MATLNSLVRSVAASPYPLEVSLVVCANGCSDGTAERVREWIAANTYCAATLEVLATASLVEAQRVVAARLKADGAETLVFVDADVVLDTECIPALLNAASKKEIKAVYAVSEPISHPEPTLVERVLNQYDSGASIFSERRHIHGRTFLIREWWIPITSPPLAADDIYLSCDLLYRFGPEAIAACHSARVYFHQVASLSDLYRSYKRRSLELSKCLHAFPHFRSLPADQLNRRIIWRRLLRESPKRLSLWFLLLLLRAYCKARLAIESVVSAPSTEWEVTTSSKKEMS